MPDRKAKHELIDCLQYLPLYNAKDSVKNAEISDKIKLLCDI